MKPKTVRPLSTELKIKAFSELNETDERIESDLEILKEWLEKCTYIKSRMDDQFLIGFLRGSKYRVEKAKEKLDMYYTSRFIAPEIYPKNKILDPRTLKILEQGISIPLPELEHPTSPRVIIIRACHYNPSDIHITEIFQMATIMYQILLMEDDNLVISGLVNVIDMNGIKAGQLTQFSPKLIEKLIFITQDALPVRQRAFHFINLPPGMTTFLNLFKSLLNKRNENRAQDSILEIYAHGSDLEKLFKYIPKRIFPEDYGGDGPAISALVIDWKRKFKEYESHFLEDEKYGTDESKRPKGSKAKLIKEAEMVGTFKKLNID